MAEMRGRNIFVVSLARILAGADVGERDRGRRGRGLVGVALGLAQAVVRAAVGREHDVGRVQGVRQPGVVSVLVGPEDRLDPLARVPHDGDRVPGRLGAADDVRAGAAAVVGVRAHAVEHGGGALDGGFVSAHHQRQRAGIGAGGAFAPWIRAYIERSGAPEYIGWQVAVKDRLNAVRNPRAHLHMPEITLEMVEESFLLWDPLRYLDTCPSSDGAMAMVMGSEAVAAAAPNPAVNSTRKAPGYCPIAGHIAEDMPA